MDRGGESLLFGWARLAALARRSKETAVAGSIAAGKSEWQSDALSLSFFLGVSSLGPRQLKLLEILAPEKARFGILHSTTKVRWRGRSFRRRVALASWFQTYNLSDLSTRKCDRAVQQREPADFSPPPAPDTRSPVLLGPAGSKYDLSRCGHGYGPAYHPIGCSHRCDLRRSGR